MDEIKGKKSSMFGSSSTPLTRGICCTTFLKRAFLKKTDASQREGCYQVCHKNHKVFRKSQDRMQRSSQKRSKSTATSQICRLFLNCLLASLCQLPARLHAAGHGGQMPSMLFSKKTLRAKMFSRLFSIQGSGPSSIIILLMLFINYIYLSFRA